MLLAALTARASHGCVEGTKTALSTKRNAGTSSMPRPVRRSSINGVQINIPSLRNRKDDIYLLFRKFVSDFSEKYNTKRISLTHNAIELLRNYRWPGNVRQLKNIAETAAALESVRMYGVHCFHHMPPVWPGKHGDV